MRLRGDLPKWRASSLDWCANPPGDRRECGRGANPPGDRRECGRPPTCSELACCGGRRPRVAIDGSNRGRRPPRVAIAGSTPWLCLEVRPPSVATRRRPATCSELACCGGASSSRYRGVRHPPRVVIVVPARGSTSSSCRNRGANRGFSRLNWSAQPTLLESLSWFQSSG